MFFADFLLLAPVWFDLLIANPALKHVVVRAIRRSCCYKHVGHVLAFSCLPTAAPTGTNTS